MVEKHEKWLVLDDLGVLIRECSSYKKAKAIADWANDVYGYENYRVEKGR